MGSLACFLGAGIRTSVPIIMQQTLLPTTASLHSPASSNICFQMLFTPLLAEELEESHFAGGTGRARALVPVVQRSEEIRGFCVQWPLLFFQSDIAITLPPWGGFHERCAGHLPIAVREQQKHLRSAGLVDSRVLEFWGLFPVAVRL